MAFYVGQKVVCINDSQEGMIGQLGDYPIKDRVYTVSKVMRLYDTWGIDVFELQQDDEGSVRWWASRFRPVVSRPTSIAIFTAMLGPKQKETA